ncbi:hypothetical protein BDZ89DRAFT_1075274 [Hymenopellis radicata]|nr:hypothetical protein BDZ89DRAFT_1075274 [Hymenopellis radicata]
MGSGWMLCLVSPELTLIARDDCGIIEASRTTNKWAVDDVEGEEDLLFLSHCPCTAPRRDCPYNSPYHGSPRIAPSFALGARRYKSERGENDGGAFKGDAMEMAASEKTEMTLNSMLGVQVRNIIKK